VGRGGEGHIALRGGPWLVLIQSKRVLGQQIVTAISNGDFLIEIARGASLPSRGSIARSARASKSR
jgi:hypothetical protein